jgi:hypothetical protein
VTSAEQRFTRACQANVRVADAWFLRGFIAWKRHDLRQAAAMLSAARTARGADWKLSGAAMEGDVRRRMHDEAAFLSVFAQAWDGTSPPGRAYGRLDQYIGQFH